MKRIIGLFLAGMLLSGCSYTFAHDDGYRMAIINEGFPVPKNAYEVKPEDCTTEIAKSAKYKMKDIGDEEGTPPAEYLAEIEKWGWAEMREAQVGNVHYFKKNGRIISLIIQRDLFDVFEMSDEVKL